MGVKWTDEQEKVIRLRNRNILVSAAAGSGKTAVLVERIITMLTKDDPPMDVDRLLIVTFTEAAASEMKERIRLAIEKKLMEYPDNEHLKQQATLIHNAQITTIHSFCLSVIRDHFHAIDIDPGFRIGEEGELKLLRHDVLEDMLEEKYQEGSKRFLDFTAAYSTGRNDKKIEDLILKIYEFSRSYPDSEAWLDSCVKAYEIPDVKALEGSSIMKKVMTDIRKNLEDAKELLIYAENVALSPEGPAVYEATLEKAVKESWIVIITKDMNTTKDLTFEGGLKKDGVETPRLLALYNQDENRNKTASYTLTAPKMTFKEDGSRIKGGTVAGDIYVDCNNFELVDATVNGNINFKDQAAKDSFKMDDTSKVTGAMELQK